MNENYIILKIIRQINKRGYFRSIRICNLEYETDDIIKNLRLSNLEIISSHHLPFQDFTINFIWEFFCECDRNIKLFSEVVSFTYTNLESKVKNFTGRFFVILDKNKYNEDISFIRSESIEVGFVRDVKETTHNLTYSNGEYMFGCGLLTKSAR